MSRVAIVTCGQLHQWAKLLEMWGAEGHLASRFLSGEFVLNEPVPVSSCVPGNLDQASRKLQRKQVYNSAPS
jgi:hypothetical protein